MSDTVLHETFRGMGSTVEVEVVGGSPGHLALARDRLAFLEARWTRFSAHSDLSRLNRAQGEPVVVDECTIGLLEAMVHGYTVTDGAFDPTLLEPIVRLGYASSVHDPSMVTEVPPGAQTRGAIRGLVIDANHGTARLPPGTVIDAGGIAKGLAADLVAERLVAEGVEGVMVSVGGDVRAIGPGPLDGGWSVAVDDAFRPDTEGLRVRLANGGLASTGMLRRSWVNDAGQPAHHLLDPTNARPTVSDFESPVHATVLAATALWAEIHVTMVVVRGAAATFHRLDRDGLAARVVDGSGRTSTNDAWDDLVPPHRPY